MKRKIGRINHSRDVDFELIYTERDIQKVKDKTALALKRLESGKKYAAEFKAKATDPKERELVNLLYVNLEKWLQKLKVMQGELFRKY